MSSQSKSKTRQNENSLQELLFQAEIEESQNAQIIDMLMEIGREFPEIKDSIISKLFEESIDIELKIH